MANEEHLKKLKEGVEAWNKWRKPNDERPDLSGADLSGYDFTSLNLSHANLEGVDLSDAYQIPAHYGACQRS